jgi:endonuclease/exonuclease/phosphatase family metal-dependent hydrolase
MVGPALVRAAPTRDQSAASDAAAATTSEAVAVLSWNTHVGAGDVVRLVRDLREGRLTAGLAVRDYVLLLQEVVRVGDAVPRLTGADRLPRAFPAPRAGFDVESVAGALGAALAYAPSMRNSPRLEDRGVAVLSSLPIEGVRVIELPLERQRRAAVVARLRGGLAVASVHFDTAAGLMAGGPGATRHRQARAIVEALSEEPAPLVIGGDLNTWWGDDEPAVKALRAVFPDAVTAPVRWTWAGPLGLTAKLDYVFARTNGNPVPVRRLPDRYGSDHYPLLAIVPAAALR